MARTVVKQVRLRGKKSPKVVGGLDIKLSLELNDKEYSVIPYWTDKDTVYGDLIAITYGKKKGIYINFTDDDYLNHYLNDINAGKSGFGSSYLNYYSVPADLPTQSPFSSGTQSKDVFSIIQPIFDAAIPEEDEDLKTRRKLWDEYNAAKDVAKAKPPVGASSSNSDGALSAVPNEPTIDPKSVTGKLFVKKKSGPGEIMGVTELEISEAKVIFKDLQFTDPGFYVITISHGESSTMVDPIDVAIEVLPEEVITPQEESRGVEPEPNVSGNRPIIAQIDKPIIVVKEIVQTKDKASGDNQSTLTGDLGFKPYIHYQSYQISERDISSLKLYHEGIVPKISFSFTDTLNIIKTDGTPTAGTTMDLFLNPASSNLKPIHFKFSIVEFNQNLLSKRYNVTGTIDVPDLYKVNNNSYSGTSFEAIRNICKDLKLGFNSNINNTTDSMSWRNPNTKPHEFIEEIIAHSYTDDESYTGGYIDYYYCFNYVDIEKEMKRDISSDVGIDTSGISKSATSDEASRISFMVLSNDKSKSSSAFYFEKYKTRNDSTKKAIAHGLSTVTKAYDRITKSFLVFNVDSTTSDGSKSLILKGAEFDKKEFETNIKTKYTGKIDTDNVHKNYNYALTQNRINLNDLNKIVLDISMPNPNFNLYKFQKIKVEIINDSSSPTEPDPMNYRYSGEYIILDITYIWNGGKLGQDVRLVRKELGKTPTEMKDPAPVEKKKEAVETNENPGATASTPLPNSVYKPGESYIVKDKDGKKYIVTIKSLSEDGKEVLANVKQIDGEATSVPPAGTDTGLTASNTTPTASGQVDTTTAATPVTNSTGDTIVNINWFS
jgi:hypothetical protein